MYSVLVAEDSGTFRKQLVEALKRRGYEVREAADGEEALKMIQSEPPDLVLSDMLMPKLDGIHVLRAMRAKAETSRIPAILLTGRDSEQVMLQARSLNAYCLLKYCITMDEVCTCVAQRLTPGVRAEFAIH